jgi:hypothetical protein
LRHGERRPCTDANRSLGISVPLVGMTVAGCVRGPDGGRRRKAGQGTLISAHAVRHVAVRSGKVVSMRALAYFDAVRRTVEKA